MLARLLGFSSSQAKRRAGELLEAFDLTDAASRRVKTFSGGMRRRIDIAASIISTPELLFLDEPTTGLDPHSRNQVWDIVRALVETGTTVLLTTQYLDEADQLADRIGVIDHGKVIAEGTSSELKSQVGGGVLQVRLHDPARRPQAEEVLARVLNVPVTLDFDPAALSASVSDSGRASHALTELTGTGIEVAGFSLGQPSLDEVFLALTGHTAETKEAEKEEAKV